MDPQVHVNVLNAVFNDLQACQKKFGADEVPMQEFWRAYTSFVENWQRRSVNAIFTQVSHKFIGITFYFYLFFRYSGCILVTVTNREFPSL